MREEPEVLYGFDLTMEQPGGGSARVSARIFGDGSVSAFLSRADGTTEVLEPAKSRNVAAGFKVGAWLAGRLL